MSEREKLDSVLARLRSGEIDGDEFVRATERYWHWLAHDLARRIDYPRWVLEHDDVYNDLVVEAFHATFAWDPTRGPTIGGYVSFTAEANVKKRLHKVRGANQHDRSISVSRVPSPFSALASSDGARTGEEMLESRLEFSILPPQEEVVDRRERVEMLVATRDTPRGRRAVLAFVALGSIAAAAARLRAEDGGEETGDEAERFVANHVCEAARGLSERLAIETEEVDSRPRHRSGRAR